MPRTSRLVWLAILLGQYRNLLIIILILATIVAAVLGHLVESIAITVIVLFSILLGFAQEYRAERALEALRSLAAPRARVRRGGVVETLDAREIVPGDVLILRTGDRVTADARLVENINLRLDEVAEGDDHDIRMSRPDPVVQCLQISGRHCARRSGARWRTGG